MAYKILYLSPVSEIGGAEVSLLNLLRFLDKDVFRPLVVLPSDGPLVERLRCLGIETIIEPMHKLNKRNVFSVFSYFKSLLRLVRIIKKRRINLMHINMSNANQYGMVAAKLSRIPVICHIRGMMNKRSFYFEFLPWNHFLIANSRATETSYKPFMRSGQQSFMIYNGLDPDDFSKGQRKDIFRKQYGINPDTFLIGCIARIDLTKGQDILIKAVHRLLENYHDVCVLIVGDTKIDNSASFLAELKTLTYKLSLDKKVIFTGFIEDITELYHELDLVVLPSRHEPFGRILIEAMAAGRPIVATRTGGVAEVVEDVTTALLVSSNDPDCLAEAMLQIIGDTELAKRLGENGRRRVRDLFTIKENVRKTMDVYNRILLS